MEVSLHVDEPYLGFVLESDPLISAVNVSLGNGSVSTLLDERAILVMEAGDPALRELLTRRDASGPSVIALVREDGEPPEGVDGVIRAPFTASEARNVVRRVAGRPTREPGAPLATTLRAFAAARIAAVIVAAIVEVVALAASQQRAIYLALAFAYVSARLLVTRPRERLIVVDLVVAAALLAATGWFDSAYLLFAVVAVVQVGLEGGIRWGAGTGGALALAGLGARLLDAEQVEWQVLVPVAVLYPLAGWLAGFAQRVAAASGADSRVVLTEAHRLLSQLDEITRAVPGGLDPASVARATLEELEDRTDAGALVLIQEGGLLRVTAGRDLDTVGRVLSADQLPQEDAGPLDTSALGPEAIELLGGRSWWCAPITYAEQRHGLVLVASDDPSPALRAAAQDTAAEAALAIENAKLFDRVRASTIDRERHQLATDLHDGLAQLLTHLRIELDIAARGEFDEDGTLHRLARVAGRAAAETRSVIAGLRGPITTTGLTASLRAYTRDLQGLGGARLTFAALPFHITLPTAVEFDLFRIGQEATSNALRHAEATLVAVSVGPTDDGQGVSLTIADDGVGIDARSISPQAGQGIGLTSMRQRAERAGGLLSVRRRQNGGTVVEVTWPQPGTTVAGPPAAGEGPS